MEQSSSIIRYLLQHKIFAHACTSQFNSYSRGVLNKLSLCHTIGIGRHHYRCNNSSCSALHFRYHSCGNRHCMNCGGMKREQWIQDRMDELLPTSYFHLVFTLPQELRSLCMGNRKLLFHLLLEASQYTIQTLSADKKWLGAQPGIISILHTNGQDLQFHPHVHCIVSGGGIDKDGYWVKEKRANGKFIYPRGALELVFKKYFIKRLEQLYQSDLLQIVDEDLFQNMIQAVCAKDWNVYAKAPFGGPAQIVEYLGRYTHKVAITIHRIKEITNTTITFSYKDYRDGSKVKLLTLLHEEFLRRFEQHILPRGFVKIRHAGFLSHRYKTKKIAAILLQLQLPAAPPKVKLPAAAMLLIKTGEDITLCPTCKIGRLVLVASYISINGQLVNVKDIKNRGSPANKKMIMP
jgi:Putative transposase/Transposase zinc-binding domain